MLNMAGSYNKPPRECASYVAESSERKHFGEAQGWEARKTPAVGDVFLLDFYLLYRTYRALAAHLAENINSGHALGVYTPFNLWLESANF
jgi:hypothetical protein